MIIVSKRFSIIYPLKIVCPLEMIEFREIFAVIFFRKWLSFSPQNFKYDKKNDSLLETQQRVKNPCSSFLKEGHLHFVKCIITFEKNVIRHFDTIARHHIEMTAALFQNDSFAFH